MPFRERTPAGIGGTSPCRSPAAPNGLSGRAPITMRAPRCSGPSTDALPLEPGRHSMTRLLLKPFGGHGKVHEVTTASAGWRYVGFSLWQLRAGETVGETTGDQEVILVMVEGKASLCGMGRDWGVLGERMSVFEKTPPHCLYLPNGAEWEATAETDCVIAVCSAPGKGGHEARRIG